MEICLDPSPGYRFLDFSEFPYCLYTKPREEIKKYNNFMGRVYLQNNVTCLKHFRIKLIIYDEETLDAMKSWLDLLRWRQYHELKMTLLGDFVPLPLPKEFLSSQRLVVLNLDGFCIDDSQDSFHLPSLESVHFGRDIVFPSDNFLKRFLLGCPVLRNLCISRGRGFRHIYVESSSLVSLEIRDLRHIKNESVMRITIKASNLRYLTLFYAYAHYNVDDLNLLTEANLHFLSYRGVVDNIVQLIKKVSWTRNMHLGLSNLSRFKDVLPKYENLMHLNFINDGCAYELLKRAPKLKSLFLDGGGLGLVGKFLDCDVPECLSCLEKVELICRLRADTSVAEYFLKNGLTLKEMVVNLHGLSIEQCRDVLQVLRDRPPSSPICQVKVLLHKDGSCILVE